VMGYVCSFYCGRDGAGAVGRGGLCGRDGCGVMVVIVAQVRCWLLSHKRTTGRRITTMTFASWTPFCDGERQTLLVFIGIVAEEFVNQEAHALMSGEDDYDALFWGKLSERGAVLNTLKRDYGAESLQAPLGQLSGVLARASLRRRRRGMLSTSSARKLAVSHARLRARG